MPHGRQKDRPMFGNQIEDQFVNSVSATDAAMRGRSQWPVLIIFMTGITALILWASLFEIEEVTTGIGRVIPSKQVQVIQTLEGGIVRSIDVREGDVVEVGTSLMQIDDTGFSSRLGELNQQASAFQAERLRLQAEAEQMETIPFTADLMKENPRAVEAERQVFSSRQRQLGEELKVLHNRLAQRKAEMRELEATGIKLKGVIAPLRREVELNQSLYKRGVVPEVEFLRLKSRLAELEGDLVVGGETLPRIAASILEAEHQINASKSAYVLSARERLAKLETELAVAQETIRAASDRVERTDLKSPARGIVNKINVTTIGAVVQPGVDIIEIVPIEDGLLIEAEIRPQDVAFIKPGEKTSVKLTAYDYLVYGALKGSVERIGADTIENKDGEEFFRVVVRTSQNYLGTRGKKFPIIPGMIASIDIQTGRHTVMTYLMKPVLRAYKESLRER